MKVYLISQPHIDWFAVASFFEDEEVVDAGTEFGITDPDFLPEFGGRLCYMSYGQGRKTNREYLANIIEQQHFSVLEHANFTFLVTGVSRSLTHELVRHRHFSFSQLSQRYVDESDVSMVVPPLLQETPEATSALRAASSIWQEAVMASQNSYAALLAELEAHVEATYPDLHKTDRKKMARQTARSVLPNATETKILVTGNLRTWREFIQKRNSRHADAEIRELAEAIQDILTRVAPNAMQGLS